MAREAGVLHPLLVLREARAPLGAICGRLHDTSEQLLSDTGTPITLQKL
jgi:hypothetical protein